jgi:pilus assembly protein CpaB
MKILEVGADQSREKNQLYNRLKPLMGKRVLAIRPAKTVVNNGVSVVERGVSWWWSCRIARSRC